MGDVFEKIHFIIMVQGFFLFILLLFRKPRTQAGGWLALFILLISMETLQMYLLEIGRGGHLIGLSRPFWFLIGPAVYIFAQTLSGRRFFWRIPYLIHFAPFVIVASYLSVTYFPLDAHAKQSALEAYIAGKREMETALVNLAAALHLTFYTVGLIFFLIDLRRRGRQVFSNLDNLRVKSIVFLATVGFLSAVLQWFNLLYPYIGVGQSTASPVVVNSIFILGSAAVYVMGIYALSHPQYLEPGELPLLFDGVTEPRNHPSEQPTGKKPPSCKEAIMTYMNEHKPYLDSNFSIKDLSDALSIPTYRVSKAINQEMGCNFFQLVNRFRVEAVKQVLDDSTQRHQKLLAIAFDAGFNSKATFNAIFKKHTGMTPSQYKNRRPSKKTALL
jgi:AraC-like DNA-binding protein